MLLPLIVVLGGLLGPRVSLLPRGRFDDVSHSARTGRSLPLLLRYICLTIAWAWLAVKTMATVSVPSGSVCPQGWSWETLAPSAQLLAVGLDAFLLHRISEIVHAQVSNPTNVRLVSDVSLLSAASLAGLSLISVHSLQSLRWAFALDAVAIRDLFLDAVLVCVALISGIYLLSVTNNQALAVTICGIGLHVQLWSSLLTHPLTMELSIRWLYVLGALACVVLLLKCHNDVGQLHQTGSAPLQKPLTYLFSILAALLVVARILIRPPSGVALHGDHVIEDIVSSARGSFTAWASQAGNSTTLEEAVVQYNRRHGMPPPPNFDRWFDFAMSHNSTIVDDFDQIRLDLAPFWGVLPSVLRERTSHLVEHPWLNIAGLRIRSGEIRLSPHTPGSHAWMMNAYAEMVKPFVKWLPDMDVAFNLNDECRVTVPFEEMTSHHSEGASSRARLQNLESERLAGWLPADRLSPPWSDRFLEKSGEAVKPEQRSPYFSDHIRQQIFYSHISPTCPPKSPARKYRWWNMKRSCVSCSQPHMATSPTGSLVSNWSLAGDLCHQVDLAYLHGFLASPAPMILTKTLFPVFSQGRVGGFADILVPSPWNFLEKSRYDDSLSIPWSQKKDTLFWRGSPSDGFAQNGAWGGFLRARFVHSALDRNRNLSAPKSAGPGINVTFVGRFGKCDERDCASEQETFYSDISRLDGLGPKGSDGENGEPAKTPFSDHWSYRHLVDLDGAGFSGRFIPFLQSYSLPYRAGIFRTWFDQRIHAWQHYVPVDIRLGQDFWKVLEFFSSSSSSSGNGNKVAEQIGLDGREWANKVLRMEDMQVYMFRLLLEWGRLVDDRREQLGYKE